MEAKSEDRFKYSIDQLKEIQKMLFKRWLVDRGTKDACKKRFMGSEIPDYWKNGVPTNNQCVGEQIQEPACFRTSEVQHGENPEKDQAYDEATARGGWRGIAGLGPRRPMIFYYMLNDDNLPE